MDNQFQQNQSQNNPNLLLPSGKPKSKYWKFVIAFLVIVILAGGGFFVWEKYFSPQAKLERQNQENYQKYLDWQANYEKAMKEDIYGGKTPEETLKMFIEALKKEDIELASKYFALNTNEKSEYYLTRKEWEEELRRAKEGGRLAEVVDVLSRSTSTPGQESSRGTFWFSVFDNKGETQQLIEMIFNSESKIWKIVNI